MKRSPLIRKTAFRGSTIAHAEKLVKGLSVVYGSRRKPPRGQLPPKKKQTHADLKRQFDIDPKLKLRYAGIKGIAWYWFARYVRLRDYQTWGRCIACNKPCSFAVLQAGHYAPAANCGLDLLMDESNVNGECGGCNGFDEGHLIGYRRGLVKRYGSACATKLEERYRFRHQVTTKISPREWEAKANHYRAAFASLDKPVDNELATHPFTGRMDEPLLIIYKAMPDETTTPEVPKEETTEEETHTESEKSE